jgi:poly(hydroxyalkanoate) depolymerase family esterase
MVDRVMAVVRSTEGVARRIRMPLVAAVLATLVVVWGQPAVARAGTAQGTHFSGSYTNSAGARSFMGYVPSGYHRGTPVPLVVALHGCTETDDVFRQLSGLDSLAEAKHFIVVYPQQDRHANPMSCWNWFINQNMQRGSGEPAIIAGLTQWVQTHYSIDPDRTFLLGFSAGGAMADVMGATYPDLYAAIGIGSGIQYGGIDPTVSPTQAGHKAFAAMGSYARVVPVEIFQGGQDDIVPPSSATKLVGQWETTDNLAAAGTVPSSPTETRSQQSLGGKTYTVAHYANAHGQDVIQSWMVPSMKHAWSGGCSCQQYSDPAGPDESSAMYDFFLKHARSGWAPSDSGGTVPGWPPAGWPPAGWPPDGSTVAGWPPAEWTIPGWPLTGWPPSSLWRIPGLT